jgi:hypothetical protein
VVRFVQRGDELHVRMQLESLGLAFAGVGVLSFVYGFLETVGYPQMSMFVVWPVMSMLWALSQIVARTKYR